MIGEIEISYLDVTTLRITDAREDALVFEPVLRMIHTVGGSSSVRGCSYAGTILE